MAQKQPRTTPMITRKKTNAPYRPAEPKLPRSQVLAEINNRLEEHARQVTFHEERAAECKQPDGRTYETLQAAAHRSAKEELYLIYKLVRDMSVLD